MVSFVNFARIASLCVGFHFGTLHGYVFHQDFWPNLNFQLEYQIKLVLKSRAAPKMASVAMLIGGALVNALGFTGSFYMFSRLSKGSIDA